MKEWLSSPRGKQVVSLLGSIVLTLIVSLAALYGFNLAVIQPQQAAQTAAIAQTDARYDQLLNELGFDLPPAPGQIGAQSLVGGGWLCKSGSRPCLDARYGRDIVVYSDNGSTQKFKVEGTTGAIDTESSISIGTLAQFNKRTTLAVTQGGVITPTGSYQPITSTTGITASTMYTSATTGDVVVLMNVNASDTIVLTNGTTVALPGAGDLTLGANDGVGLVFNGTKWVALFSVNN